MNAIILILASVFAISLISFIGAITLFINKKILDKILLYLVSFSAGALFADAFIHLIPEALEQTNITLVSIYVLTGILFSFIIEKFVQWRHCHVPTSKRHPHPVAYMNIVGDVVHNLIDGMIIAGSYLVSIPLGIATTIAVIFHEIPQEIGDFGVLIYGGFNRNKALMVNFLTALSSFIGVFLTLILSKYIGNISLFLVPFAAGNFIYIAGSDLIPELHKETDFRKSAIQLFSIVLGIAVMLSLLLLE
jgi:zinc and cadmium transporter